MRMCVCASCVNGDPLHCTHTHFSGEWKGERKKGTAGNDEPVDFPLIANRNEADIRKQMEGTRIMFDDIVSYTEEF